MAQKKLLSLLVLLLAFTVNASATERYKTTKDDMEFATDLARRSRQFGMDAIKEKWLELQRMQQQEKMSLLSGNQSPSDIDQAFDVDAALESRAILKIFVSSSMGTELLKNYVNQAKRYKATLVFNGLPENSWRKLSAMVHDIAGSNEEGVEIQLDDLAFAEYSITSVPSFVLCKEQGVFDMDERDLSNNVSNNVDGSSGSGDFDKVVGNIGIRRALEEIVEHGDLADQAQEFLEEAKG